MSNASLKVKIFETKGTQVLQIGKSALTLGSAAHCDVVVDHPSVHAEHARAWLEGGRVWVQDLGGENGTSLNEIRLPSLKPMLVRELDVLRLGQFEATIGLEPSLVRTPAVKARVSSAPAEESPKPAAKDVETAQRKAELETLSRELANVRLQLQMAKLEKNSTQDASDSRQNLTQEIRGHQEQKRKWSENLRRLELEKEKQREKLEKEIQALKARLDEDITQVSHQLEKERRQRETHAAEVELLRAKLAKAPAPEIAREHQALKSEVTQLREQKKQLSENVDRQRAELEGEITALRARLEKAPAPEIAREHQTLKNEVAQLREQKKQLGENVAHQRAELEGEITTLRARLDKAPAPEIAREHQTLKNEVAQLREQKKQLSENVARQRAELEGEITSLRTRLDQAPRPEALAEQHSLRQNLEGEKRRRVALEGEVATLKQKLEQAPAPEIAREYRALKDEVQALREQKREWAEAEQRQRETLEGEITALRTRLDHSPKPEQLSDYQALKNEVKYLHEQRRQVIEQEARHRETLEGEIQALQEQKQRWSDTHRQLEEERQRRKDLENEIRGLQARLSKAPAPALVDELRAQAAAEVEHERQQRKELDGEVRALKVQLKGLEEQKMKWGETARQLEQESARRREQENELKVVKSQLAKAPSPELVADYQELKAEVKTLPEHRRKLGELSRALEKERAKAAEQKGEIQSLRARLDKAPPASVVQELEALKAERGEWEKARREMQRQQDEMENAPRLQVGELSKRMRSVSTTLVKRWSTRPLSQDMIFEWEGEMTQIFRHVLLNETEPQSEMPEAQPMPDEELAGSRPAIPWRKLIVRTVGAAFVLAVIWLAWHKQGTSWTTLSSTAPSAKAPVRQPAARFEPKISKKYRDTYTDNVLHLENYVGAEENLEFRKRWMAELNKVAVNDWKMDQWSMAPVAVKEVNLIKDLNRIKNSIMTTDQEVEGIKKMRAREAAFMKDLEAIFKSHSSVDRYLKFKRSFYIRNQAYLTKETI